MINLIATLLFAISILLSGLVYFKFINLYMLTKEKYKIKVKIIDKNKSYHLPKFSNEYAAGADLYAEYFITENAIINVDNYILHPGDCIKIGTNIAVELPENTYLDICSRSGLSINKGLVVTNSPARIDNDYRGELIVGLRNISNDDISIYLGTRIAQCTLHNQLDTEYIISESLSKTERDSKGLGSSGI